MQCKERVCCSWHREPRLPPSWKNLNQLQLVVQYLTPTYPATSSLRRSGNPEVSFHHLKSLFPNSVSQNLICAPIYCLPKFKTDCMLWGMSNSANTKIKKTPYLEVLLQQEMRLWPHDHIRLPNAPQTVGICYLSETRDWTGNHYFFTQTFDLKSVCLRIFYSAHSLKKFKQNNQERSRKAGGIFYFF